MPTPSKLVDFVRDGLFEQEHFGYVLRIDQNDVVDKIGESEDYPFFLRSCAKPLQAALLIDYCLDKEFDMTLEEIAICCASHAGEFCHTKVVQNLLNKFGFTNIDLKCGEHLPISKTAQNDLLLRGENPTQLHNNCSGKHTMMLGLCRLKGWSITDYDVISHPLQQAIKNKIYDLCELDNEFPITKDGCGVPIYSMPLYNILKGYINLFCNPYYKKIKNAFLNYPYIIGGENRTDTKIIKNSKNLIAKVGAGGLIVVVNTELEQGFVVKICDSNMDAREIVAIDYINKLDWGKIVVNHDIKTNHGDVVGQIVSNI